MTTFEITIIVLLAAIVVLLGFIAFCAWNHYRDVELNNFMSRKKLDNIDTNTATSVGVGIDTKDKVNYIAQDVESISNNFLYLLDESKGLPFKIDWDKLSKEQQDEFLKRLILPNYDNPTQPIYTPCYAPDGVCMNPYGDCINCPKRGNGGTWTTSINTIKED